jgi:hypothetical protein
VSTYKPRKLSIQTSVPSRLNEGAKRPPIAAKDFPQLQIKATAVEEDVGKTVAEVPDVSVLAPKESGFGVSTFVPTEQSAREEGSKKSPPVLSITIPPPVQTPSMLPRFYSAAATGISSSIPGSYRFVTDLASSNTIVHSLAKVMNAPSVTPTSHRPIRVPTATEEVSNKAAASSGKSSIPISHSMAGIPKSATTYASTKHAPKHKNIWSSTRERLGLAIKTLKTGDVSGTVAEI